MDGIVKRLYTHSLVTYSSKEEFQPLLKKSKAWAYIYHNKDDTDPHYHILITFSEKKSFNWINKQIISNQNTFSEEIKGDVEDILIYFTHIKYNDKHHYEKEEIIYSDINYWNKRIGKESTLNDEANEQFLEDLLSPYFDTVEMAKKYGRDFIRNYQRYVYFRHEVRQCEVKNIIYQTLAENNYIDTNTGEFVDGNYKIQNGKIYKLDEEKIFISKELYEKHFKHYIDNKEKTK